MKNKKSLRQEYESEIRIIEGILKKVASIKERRLDEILQAANDVDTDQTEEPEERFRVSRKSLLKFQIFYYDLKERNQK